MPTLYAGHPAHPAAERFPLLSGADLAADVAWQGIIREPFLFAEIVPSTLPGFFWLSLVQDGGVQDYFTRPVRQDGLLMFLEAKDFDAKAAHWTPRARAAEQDCPWREREHERSDGGEVYFIQADCGGPIKIGVSACADSRLDQLQQYSPFPLRVLATMPGGFKKERQLHARFAAHRLHGEWFEAVPELLTFIAEAR